MLGFNRTHHMVRVITDDEGREVKEWTRALRAKYRGQGTFTKLDWDRLLGRSEEHTSELQSHS